MRVKVCHMTTVHTRYDIRIFRKMCLSLAKNGYNVNLLVADGLGYEINSGVTIFDLGKPIGRLDRMLNVTKRLLKKAIEIDAEVYHFHDPELIPAARKLLKKGKIVIMDAHEDFPKQILGKPYLKPYVKKALSIFFNMYENFATKGFSTIICATNTIGAKFTKFNKNVIVINNYPIVNELFSKELLNQDQRSKNVCYVGGISKIRGIEEIVNAAEKSVELEKLVVAGNFNSKKLGEEIRKLEGWKKVEELGSIDRNGVKNVLSKSIAGLVTFLPQENHIDSQPNKMFEYMSAGIAVIGSNFPLWKEIIEVNDCGICIDPLNPDEIANGIDYLILNPEVASKMGMNGRKAVLDKYNWEKEEQKLFKAYESLLIV